MAEAVLRSGKATVSRRTTLRRTLQRKSTVAFLMTLPHHSLKNGTLVNRKLLRTTYAYSF